VVELSWAAGFCPCVEKLRIVLPFSDGIRDEAVQLQLALTHHRVRAHEAANRVTIQ
jgi:hypothetical protein